MRSWARKVIGTVLVTRDRRTSVSSAHAVPTKGLAHEHGAQELLKDNQMLRHLAIVLKCGGETALRSVPEEVKRRGEGATVLDNSGVGDVKLSDLLVGRSSLSERRSGFEVGARDPVGNPSERDAPCADLHAVDVLSM